MRSLLRQAARPRRMLLGAGLLAAAAALVLIVRPAGRRPATRRRRAADARRLWPDGRRAARLFRFVWAAAPGVASYRLTVSGADGAPVWSGSLADTVAVLPDSVALRVDQRYLWVADALLDDGSSRSTGLREFRPVR